jgi:hypothetical protein
MPFLRHSNMPSWAIWTRGLSFPLRIAAQDTALHFWFVLRSLVTLALFPDADSAFTTGICGVRNFRCGARETT